MQRQLQGRSSDNNDGRSDWFPLGFSCGFMLDISYGFFVGFSFYWFWFGFGMSFSLGIGCGGDSWVVLSWGFSIFLLLHCWVVVIIGKERNSNEVESQTREKKREWGGERKNNKILNTHATVTVHIFTVIFTIVHLCTILHPLMWVFFDQKV